MPDDLLQETIKLRFPRLLAAGVDYNDAQAILKRVARFEQWMDAWAELGDLHESLGEAALAEGRTITAGEAFQRAALYHHIGQSVFFDDPEAKARAQARQRVLYAKAAPHLRPPAEVIDIAFEGGSFPANLRLPDGPGPHACVMLTCGADSTKEEFHTLEGEFLKRGVATCAYDGPGQSLTRQTWPLRPDFEVPVGAVIDALSARPDIDAGRIGIWGRSFGGYAAPRGATDPRMKACISIGGFFDLADIWDRCPASVQDTLRFGFGDDTVEAARETAKAYTLAEALPRVACPLLIVHSGQDTVCPVAESERMKAAAGGEAELVVFPEGNHVCDNIPYKARPLMADWMAARLSA